MITNAELTQMKARAEKATAGPWYSHVDGTVFLKHTQEIADVWTDNEEADAAFIAHAREDVPRLVAEVEHLSALLRQRDRQLEGERKGSQRVQAEVERLNRRLRLIDDEILAQFYTETSEGYELLPEYEGIRDTVQEVMIIACGAPITGEEEYE